MNFWRSKKQPQSFIFFRRKLSASLVANQEQIRYSFDTFLQSRWYESFFCRSARSSAANTSNAQFLFFLREVGPKKVEILKVEVGLRGRINFKKRFGLAENSAKG